jgi:predicted O-methyltransferase YrrM
MRTSIFIVLMKRLALIYKGNHYGVNLHFLSSSTNGIYSSIKELLLSKDNNEIKLQDHSLKSKSLFLEFKEKSTSIAEKSWDAELELFTLIYSIVRTQNSLTVVETGVANGATTYAIMSALEKNGAGGVLHSFDILPDAAKAYSGDGNWHFHLLEKRTAYKGFKRAITAIGPVDIWIHDSDHGYRWQKFEYRLAISSLKPGGILISDDVDTSPAWGELAKSLFRKSFIIFDARKLIGLALK